MIVSFRHPDGCKESTRISSSIDAAGTTLTVLNTEGLVADDYIILGTVGSECTEIVKITSVDSDTQLTIGATNFAHDIDDLVSFVPYNQIAFYSATTETGTKTKQGSNVDLDVDDLVTEVNLASVSSGYVFARYYNSTSAAWSGYSSSVPVSGFAENSLRYIIDMARLRTQELKEDLVSDDDLLKIAKECSDEIETVKKNWSFTQESTDTNLTAAIQTYAKPTDLAGYESIASMYLGYDNASLNYIDLKEFRYKMRSMPKTVSTAQITSGSTTINVKDTTAFGTSGTLALNGDTSIPYTGKTNKSFTGVTGVTGTHASGVEIFKSSDLDQPTDYTIWEDNLLLYPPVDKFYNLNIDYYKSIPRMTTVSSTTSVPMPSLFIWYLMSEIFRMRSRTTRANFYATKFETMLKSIKMKDRHLQRLKMLPDKSYIQSAIESADLVLEERIKGGA